MFFFNNITLRGAVPTFLSVQDFDDWSNKFVNLFNQMTLDPTYMIRKTFPFNLIIEFNDTDCPTKGYGLIPRDEVLDKVNKIVGSNKKSTKEKITKIVDLELDPEYISDELRDKYDPEGAYEKLKEIEDIVSLVKSIDEIPAVYIKEDNKIIFYKKVINKLKNARRTLISIYEECYIPVLFYSYLYSINNNPNIDYYDLLYRNDYISEIIKCSLSEYFSKEYCDKFGINHDEKFTRVSRRSVVYYPFSGFKCIYNIKFFELLPNYQSDMDSALRLLLNNPDLYYQIKNKKEFEAKKRDKVNIEYPDARMKKIHNAKPIYLLPYDEVKFYNNVKAIGSYSILVQYKDGSIDTHIEDAASIGGSNDVISSITNLGIIQNNSRFDDIIYIIASCNKYDNPASKAITNTNVKINTKKDYSHYSLDGVGDFNKSNLPLGVIERFVYENNPDLAILKNAFPFSLRKKPIYELEGNVSARDKGIGGRKRYYAESPITLSDGNVILVSNQWCKEDIDIFIEHVVVNIRYDIKKIK